MKIKGILAMGDITYDEFAKLVGTSRQTLYKYLNDADIHLEDTELGMSIINKADKIMSLCSEGKLPLPKDSSKEVKLERLHSVAG